MEAKIKEGAFPAPRLAAEEAAYPGLRELLDSVDKSASRRRLLVVEDDDSMQDFYRQFFDVLHSDEFDWELAGSAERGLAALRRAGRPFDAVVLDWNLPGKDGIALLRELRTDVVWQDIRVIMVTGRRTVEEEVAALEVGADDFIPKPFHPDELWARLRSLLRRAEPEAEAQRAIRIGDLELDVAAGKLTVGGKAVRLYKKELDLLVIFLRRPDVIHPPAFLWDAVWGYDNPNHDNVLDVTLSNLRRKLGPKWAARLENRRGQGYLLRLKG